MILCVDSYNLQLSDNIFMICALDFALYALNRFFKNYLTVADV